MTRLIILDDLSYQTYPITTEDKTILVSDETLAKIGITKKFDKEHNCVVDMEVEQKEIVY